MKITDYLIDKLKNANDTFEYKNETYKVSVYGQGSRVCDGYTYWDSQNSNKVIKMEYVLKKIGEDHYSGYEKIKAITIWEDYDEGIVLDEWYE